VSVGLGLYYGLQTVFLEVGLAHVLAVYGVRRRGLKSSDGVGYGLSLAFWENGVLIGAFSLLNLSIVYLLIAYGSGAGQAIYTSVSAAQPAYFLPPSSLLPSALLGTLERLSSMLAHVAWGVLCVLAAVTGRRRYLGYALPMGMLDALVPFASLNVALFEGVVFLLSVGFALIAWRASREAGQKAPEAANAGESTQAGQNSVPLKSLTRVVPCWMLRRRMTQSVAPLL
jgi:membrane protein implicated in regulation of membrane protease activity